MEKKQRMIIAAMWGTTALAAVVLGGVIWFMKLNSASALTNNSLATPAQELFPDPSQPAVSASALPILFDAPPFTLIDQDGKTFASAQLTGKVWIADFIFTQCSGYCPVMTANMAEFQNKSAGSPVQMVSFSVDPENDTPAVLKQYAAAAKADETRWHFLTGTRARRGRFQRE